MNDGDKGTPEITEDMTFDEAYSLALEHGEETIVSFKKESKRIKVEITL